MKAARHEAMLQLLQVRGRAGIAEIADALDVSEATVRRDVAELERQGSLHRTWGGVEIAGGHDDPFHESLVRHGVGKARIAKAASALIKPEQTIILDIGTTVHHLVLSLPDVPLTILTPSLAAFEALRGRAGIGLVLLGGRWSEPYQCFEGETVVDALARQQADIAFLGCSGVADSGRVRDTSFVQNASKRAMQAAATRSILLADASKFPGQGNSSPFDLVELDGLITDLDTLPPRLEDSIRQSDLEVIHA